MAKKSLCEDDTSVLIMANRGVSYLEITESELIFAEKDDLDAYQFDICSSPITNMSAKRSARRSSPARRLLYSILR